MQTTPYANQYNKSSVYLRRLSRSARDVEGETGGEDPIKWPFHLYVEENSVSLGPSRGRYARGWHLSNKFSLFRTSCKVQLHPVWVLQIMWIVSILHAVPNTSHTDHHDFLLPRCFYAGGHTKQAGCEFFVYRCACINEIKITNYMFSVISYSIFITDFFSYNAI